jgi:uncharacterized protein (TIGR02145 family)
VKNKKIMENQKSDNKKLRIKIIRDIVIKPRTPKWERKYLEKKEAEEYLLLCRDSACHPAIRKAKKARHFLKWAIKLLVPDFLIGYPNLWDNLKTLRKHPQFHPLRAALVAWVIFAVTFGSLGIYSLQHAVRVLASSPVTDTYTDASKIAASTDMTVSGGQLTLSVAPWACGDTLVDTRDSKEYDTVQIGNQCWMAENLNYGTMTAGANSQGSDCPSVAETEKYCYSDTESNCTSDGALYQWAQAMCGAASCNGTGAPPNDACASPVQGICPDGWHIPSHYEYTTLEREVCDSGTCATDFPYDISTTDWRGTDEGGQMKGTTICGTYPCWNSPNTGATNSSGFTAWAAGYRSTDGSFSGRGTYAFLWSSLESGSNAWRRALYSGNAAVSRNALSKLYGFSVRCVQD